jgi:hypothetical protein
MIRIQYTATRALSGHAIGDTVTLTFSAAEMTPTRKVTRDVQKTLSGRRETLHHNGLRSWIITTEPLGTTTLDAFEEFMTAVETGATFEFEPFYSTEPASPNTAENRLRATPTINCVMDSESYSLARLIGDGTGGQSDWYQVTFTVEEVPT